jgi:hypothetical protein
VFKLPKNWNHWAPYYTWFTWHIMLRSVMVCYIWKTVCRFLTIVWLICLPTRKLVKGGGGVWLLLGDGKTQSGNGDSKDRFLLATSCEGRMGGEMVSVSCAGHHSNPRPSSHKPTGYYTQIWVNSLSPTIIKLYFPDALGDMGCGGGGVLKTGFPAFVK